MLALSVPLVLLFALNGYHAEPLKEGAPADVSDEIRKELAEHGTRISKSDKTPYADLWFRKKITLEPQEEDVGVKLTELKPGTLVGVIRFHGAGSDFRAQNIKAGLYTLRYIVQPQDGNHQGVSDTRDFFLMLPIADDKSPAALAPEQVVKLSQKASGTAHPAVLWVARLTEDVEKLPQLCHDEQAERWTLQCEIPTSGEKPLRLSLVVIGKAWE